MCRSLSRIAVAALACVVCPNVVAAAPTELLIGNPPDAAEPRLNLQEFQAKKPRPLFLVIGTPYEIWSGMGTYVHTAVYRGSSRSIGWAPSWSCTSTSSARRRS